MFPKKRWLEEIISCLKEIASAEFQEKGWVKGEIHDYCRFAGTICCLYEDFHFEYFIEQYAEKFGLSAQQIRKLDQLRNALNAYIDKHGCYEEPNLIVKDPEWIKIRMLAKECIEALGIQKYLDPSKKIPKEALLHLISNFESTKLQERIWIKERNPGKNPFREWMEKFFNSYAYKTQEIITHFRDYEITEEQQRYLVRLYDTLKPYWEKMKGEEDLRKVLEDPEWHYIQSLSREVSNAFKEPKN